MSGTLALPYVRPMPPEGMRGIGLGFARAEAVEEFIYRHYLDRDGLFFDAEHGHLTSARIGVVWAQSRHTDKGSEKAGTMQLLRAGSEPRTWADAVQRIHLHDLFGPALPEFKMTLHAPTCGRYDDRNFFALLDHELCHGDVRRVYGAPVFNDAGRPVWTYRPHDVETFNGTVARWGAPASGAAALVEAGAKAARFAWVPGTDLDVHRACGSR